METLQAEIVNFAENGLTCVYIGGRLQFVAYANMSGHMACDAYINGYRDGGNVLIDVSDICEKSIYRSEYDEDEIAEFL